MCEAVRFEVAEAPPGCGVCHCKRCQRRTGTAFSMTAPIGPGQLTITAGEDAIRWYDPGDGGWIKAFCGTCGSALFTRNPAVEHVTAVRMGAFDTDFGARPMFHQFTDYAPPWGPVPDDGLPRFPERIPASRLP
jgi:hypothetical protein